MRITSLYRGARELDPGIRVEDVIAVILLGGNEPLGFAGLCKCIACVSVFYLEAHMQLGLPEHRCRSRCVRALYMAETKVTRQAVYARGVALRISLATHLLNVHSGLYVDDSPGLRRPAVHQPAYTSARTHHVN
jgi:hypothetical protein